MTISGIFIFISVLASKSPFEFKRPWFSIFLSFYNKSSQVYTRDIEFPISGARLLIVIIVLFIALIQKLMILSSFSRFMLTKLKIKPKNLISCCGINTDFSKLIVKPSFCNMPIVFLKFSRQIR